MVLATTCKRLLEDYEISDISESRKENLNRFMQFCGVSYQMVSRALLFFKFRKQVWLTLSVIMSRCELVEITISRIGS
jgi:hypothetical protein